MVMSSGGRMLSQGLRLLAEHFDGLALREASVVVDAAPFRTADTGPNRAAGVAVTDSAARGQLDAATVSYVPLPTVAEGAERRSVAERVAKGLSVRSGARLADHILA